MVRRNESPEKKRRRELIGEFLKENPIQGMSDINELVKKLISQVIEKGLEGEMDIDVPRDRKGEFESGCQGNR